MESKENIIGHYRFVQNLPVKHRALLLPDRDVLLVHFTGKMVRILIFTVLQAVLIVKEN